MAFQTSAQAKVGVLPALHPLRAAPQTVAARLLGLHPNTRASEARWRATAFEWPRDRMVAAFQHNLAALRPPKPAPSAALRSSAPSPLWGPKQRRLAAPLLGVGEAALQELGRLRDRFGEARHQHGSDRDEDEHGLGELRPSDKKNKLSAH